MESSKVRIRPLRFAFLVDPKDKASLQRVFEINSCLWGGVYNFIIPLSKQLPPRYRQTYVNKQISGKAFMNGLVDTFQPDFLLETKPGQIAKYEIEFPSKRSGDMAELEARDERGRCKIGVDLRSVCDDLYRTTFRFVQRHPPKVIMPISTDKRYQMLFSALFGHIPSSGPTADVAEAFMKALDGKEEKIKPVEFPKLLNKEYLHPLRLTTHDLDTRRNSWSIDSKLFYMDEKSSLDLIELWNYRALGWDILPLPARLAPEMVEFCETFLKFSYRPYPAPSNAFHSGSFLCARSQSRDEMQAFAMKLKRPDEHSLTLDDRVPRIWEEWGRSADHAEPQTVEHANKSVNTYVIGNGLHISGEMPEFSSQERFSSTTLACANVIESVSDETPIIPWKKNVAASLTHDFGDTDKTWISREGIVIFAGQFGSNAHIRVPNGFNIFTAVAEAVGRKLVLSSAGKTYEQVVAALGGIDRLAVVARSEHVLRLIDNLAREGIEIEEGDDKGQPRKRLFKSYALLGKVLEAVKRANPGPLESWQGNLNALVRFNVLKIGMALKCAKCGNASWFSLKSLSDKIRCPRCTARFKFPASSPPDRDSWAYKVIGPFAVGNFAQGSYCVASSVHFLKENVARRSTWVPSFEMVATDKTKFEADFGMFALPSIHANATSPYMILGECKSFNKFEVRDFARAREAAALFPGAVLCFCTFRDALSKEEIRGIGTIAIEGRKQKDIQKPANPVLILTGRELFGQWQLGDISNLYGNRAPYAKGVYMRDDLHELCNFTQELYLGMPSSGDWYETTRQKRIAKLIKQGKMPPFPALPKPAEKA